MYKKVLFGRVITERLMFAKLVRLFVTFCGILFTT